MTDKIINLRTGEDLNEKLIKEYEKYGTIEEIIEQLQAEKENSKDTYEMYQALMESFNTIQKKLRAEKQKNKELQEKYKKYDELENWLKTTNLPKTEKGLKQFLFEAETKVMELEEGLKQVQNENLNEIVELIRKNGLEDNVVFRMLDIESKKKDKYKQALEEIKEIANSVYTDEENQYQATGVCYEILKKCEVLKDE